MRTTIVAAMAIGVAAGLIAAAPAQAVTFADYGATSGGPNLAWTHATGTLATTGVGASAAAVFSFVTPTLSSLKNLPALFTLNASSPDAAAEFAGQVIQPDVSGTFSFIYDGPTTAAITTGANLLSGTFSGASISGPDGSSVGAVEDAIVSGGSVSFTSAFETFASTGDKGLSLSLTSVMPGLGVGKDGGLSSFTAVSTGSFASGVVPEPGVWVMMLVGVAGIGVAGRRRRRGMQLGLAT